MRQENHKYAYQTEQFPCNLIQAYADDTLLIANSAEGLQKLIDDADTFFKFVSIKLNIKKCEIFRTNSKTNQIIKIAVENKEYFSELEYVKYLGVPLGSKRISKVKFAEAKIQKMLYEIDRLEYSGLAINQMLKIIRIMILTQPNYLFSNGFILNRQAEVIDKRIRRLIYNFTKDKTISKDYIYTPLEYGGLGIAEAKIEMHAYRIHHVARLLLKNEGQKIMKEYFNLQGETIPKFLSLSESLDHSLKEVSLIWDD
jgi:hypothetical protein